MSLTRRRELLAFAERHGVAIIEDAYDSEYRHTDRPLEPLQRLDRTGRVIYVGTFSKTLAPSIRIGFVPYPNQSSTRSWHGGSWPTGNRPPPHRTGCIVHHQRDA
jgi:DNA-binding transcriptional MocR family regulator